VFPNYEGLISPDRLSGGRLVAAAGCDEIIFVRTAGRPDQIDLLAEAVPSPVSGRPARRQCSQALGHCADAGLVPAHPVSDCGSDVWFWFPAQRFAEHAAGHLQMAFT
jgi:hypothetical protein